MRLSFTLIIFLFLSWSTLKGQDVTIQVTFENAPTIVEVSKAPLKYDKDFAYSFSMDDGMVSNYLVAFPLFQGDTLFGSYVDSYGHDQGADSTISAGYYYTDGCGNDINFVASLSLVGSFLSNSSIYGASMTWDMVKEVYAAGWDVSNHTYQHLANEAGIQYDWQIEQNIKQIKANLGFVSKHFTIPSADLDYIDYAFDAGHIAAYGMQTYFQGYGGLMVDSLIDFDSFQLYRQYMSDANTLEQTQRGIDSVASKSVNGAHIWYNDFTHSVGNDNKWGISVSYLKFREYMDYVHDTYGKNGDDRMWMCTLQEGLEYLIARDSSILTSSLDDNILSITLDVSDIAIYHRRHDLSLLVDADEAITDISFEGISSESHNLTDGLINLSWEPLDSIPPQGVMLMFKGTLTDHTAYISWSVPTDNRAIAGYILYKSGEEYRDVGLTNSLTLEDLRSGTEYEFFVKAYDAAGNLSNQSTTIRFSTTGITGTLAMEEAFEVYPNPTDGHLNLDFKEKTMMQILSISGSLIDNQFFGIGKSQYDMNLPSGIYLLRLESSSYNKTIKISIE